MSIQAFADSHDPFWPRVDLAGLHAHLVLHCNVSEIALDIAARCAVIDAAREFSVWRAALKARGYNRLEDVSGHAAGRALRVCYVRFVEVAIVRSACGMASRGLGYA
ncbi:MULTISPECIES: head completion/stabilization protein [Pseudomonas]|uniref:Head completion/stabilization protein n=1 Tax=Pseudomonas mosselii TaxID=78327 RepID=A0A5R8YLR0_9PSED|nr:head completion/stabilization protein [Pseudomonas mosselii]TLP54412.1 head completion/stabilization protein [Pseudomonas mosselii]